MSESFNQILFYFAVVVWLVLSVRAWRHWRILKRWVDPARLHERLQDGEDVFVLDVRTEEEFKTEGHIKGAVNLPLGDLPARLREMKEDLKPLAQAPVVVVCKIGGRSTSAVPKLHAAGLKQASIMRGGMRRWEELGLPVQKK